MRHVVLIFVVVLAATAFSAQRITQTQLKRARARMRDLRFGSYATSRQVEQLATDETHRQQAWNVIQRVGITKLYLEVYRGGHIVPAEHLASVRDWLRDKDIDVVGGIATVPGRSFGVRQEGPLDWFNWQNEKTQRDLERVMRMAAGIFDTFIIDDFLCTGDVSMESKTAKGDRSWGEYRRALLTELAQSIFIGPAKQVNPSVTMIVKFPQWYDRFHLFGYDVETFPRIFDRVWVGTETRGRNTQRFGFVQPYEGFINYRWLAEVAGDRIGGAWFDHGDCAEYDFLDQAHMSILAGASELVFFNFGNIMAGHPDHEKVIAQFDRLADLAAFVREYPVVGVPAYKPPNSDPKGDMYVMDFIGMLGIPLIPVHTFPDNAPVIFLPASAASDPRLLDHMNNALARGSRLIVTTSLLIALLNSGEIVDILGISPDIRSKPTRALLVSSLPKSQKSRRMETVVDLESPIQAEAGHQDIVCTVGDKHLAFLTVAEAQRGGIVLLNTHTYSQDDFDAVGEVLLCPRPLGLLAMEGTALSRFRAAFGNPMITHDDKVIQSNIWPYAFAGPSCVTFHPFHPSGEGICVVQNFNDRTVNVSVSLQTREGDAIRFVERFTGTPIAMRASESSNRVVLEMSIPARGRIWVQRIDEDTAR